MEIWFHLANVLYVVSYLVTDILWLRAGRARRAQLADVDADHTHAECDVHRLDARLQHH